MKLKNVIKKVIKNPYVKRDIYHLINKIKLYGDFYPRHLYYALRKKNKVLSPPATLQFPITNKCNLDCAMCNIHANDSKNELTAEDIRRILSNPIFGRIISVGINGGEPFILSNITELIEIVVKTLPSVKNLYMISNGTIPSCTEKAIAIKKICEKNNVKFTLSFSIDGFENVHDEMRGRKGTFKKLMHTVDEILKAPAQYCDYLNFICTLTKKNIYYVNELEAFAKKIGITVSYNVATVHERLKNDVKYQEYSLFTDEEAKMLAREFFYSKFRETNSKTYYALFRYLCGSKPVRCAECAYLHNAITLTPNGDICYCATHSKALANAKNTNVDIEQVYYENKEYNDYIKKNYCASCSHYMGRLTKQTHKEYIKELLKDSKKPMEG